MTDSYITHNSFKFGSTDMWDTWQIRVLDIVDYLKPKLRSRKVEIPLRNGKYDYGAEYYDERALKLKCIRMADITRNQLRLLAYDLKAKKAIRLYDAPDVYYIGQIYNEPELSPIRNGGVQITFDFVCEPFGNGSVVSGSFTNARYKPNYQGTAPTPTYIVIENTGNTDANYIQIVQSIKREA